MLFGLRQPEIHLTSEELAAKPDVGKPAPNFLGVRHRAAPEETRAIQPLPTRQRNS